MTDLPNVAQEFTQQFVEITYRAVRQLDIPGTGYVVAGDLGEGIIDIRFKFEDGDGNKVNNFMRGRAASEAMDLVIDWLHALSKSPQRSWKVVLCGVRTTGQFSVVPVYSDDHDIRRWDFEAAWPVDLVELAKPVLAL